MATLETHDIQGLVLSGYFHLTHSSFLFLHFSDAQAAKKWLGETISLVTSAKYPPGPDGKPEKPPWALNLAFTALGLEELGHSVAEFSQEFREDISEPSRSKRLGDTHQNAPDQWDIGGSRAENEAIHACLMVQTATQDELETRCAEQIARFEAAGVQLIAQEFGYLPDDGVEHFGFADAISEPDIVGSPKRVQDEQSCVEAGEFVLGYANEYAMLPATPTVAASLDAFDNLPDESHARESGEGKPDGRPNGRPDGRPPKDLGRNGTYLVFRKLHQDVAGWRRYFAAQFPDNSETMQAKFIGRWKSGAPLALYPDHDPFANTHQGEGRVNNFGYAKEDAGGLKCPIGAHIRRVNPRDSLENDPGESIKSVNRHRLLRRGALYGAKLSPGALEDDGVGRGVLFFGVNADIKRQFEFIQQTWIGRPKFNGLYDERDPVLANQSDRSGLNNFTIQGQPLRQRVTELPQFVCVRGGAYFFLPGIAALSFFAGVKTRVQSGEVAGVAPKRVVAPFRVASS